MVNCCCNCVLFYNNKRTGECPASLPIYLGEFVTGVLTDAQNIRMMEEKNFNLPGSKDLLLPSFPLLHFVIVSIVSTICQSFANRP